MVLSVLTSIIFTIQNGLVSAPVASRPGFEKVRPLLEAVAARVEGEPCVAYLGAGAAGHYVKMVHNGIEYAIMQVISETYDLMRAGAGAQGR